MEVEVENAGLTEKMETQRKQNTNELDRKVAAMTERLGRHEQG